MYGDCQVIPSSPSMMLQMGGGGAGAGAGGAMGGGGVVIGGGAGPGGGNMMLLSGAPSSSAAIADSFFSSPHRNPNHNLSSFMATLPPFHAFSTIIPVSPFHPSPSLSFCLAASVVMVCTCPSFDW